MVWPHVNDFLKAAIKKSNEQDRADLGDIVIDIITGRAQLFIAIHDEEIIAAAVTLIVDQYNGKSLNIYLLGGKKILSWVDCVHAQIVEFAGCNDIKWIDACPRPGIGELIKNRFGYKEQNVCYTLEVNHE